MDSIAIKKLLKEHLALLDAAAQVLSESHARVVPILAKSATESLSVEERESCEALTARFSRLCDFLFQRVFRTIDQIELLDEGSGIDRLNRMEKRGVIDSAELWKNLRALRNEIAHEYLIEKSDRVLRDAHQHAPDLLATARKIKDYVKAMGY